MRASTKNGIIEGVIWKQILIFFFPILFGTFFQQLYNTVDAIVVGNFVGKEALGAVGGTTGTLINLLVGFFVGLSGGATVIISQYFGASDHEKVSQAVHTSMMLGIVGGAVMMLVGLAGSKAALQLMQVPQEIMAYSVTYMRVYFIGIIPNMIYNIGSGILRAVGDSKRPLLFLIVACMVNIVLDLFFVIVLHWEVFGVAFATILSQAVSAVLVIITLTRSDVDYKLEVKELHFTPSILKSIVLIGLPAGLQSVAYSLSNVIIQSSVNAFGTDAIAAWTAYGKIDSLFWMTMSAFGVAITTFAGQNFGAGRIDRMKKSVHVCLAMAIGTAVTMSVLFWFAGPLIYRLFTNDVPVIEKGMEILRLLSPFFVSYVFIEIFSGAMRGCGDSLIPMVMTALGVCGVRVVWILGIAPRWHELSRVLLCYPLSWVLTSIFFLIYYLHGGWLRKSLHRRQAAVE